MALGFLNCVDPWTHDLTIIYKLLKTLFKLLWSCKRRKDCYTCILKSDWSEYPNKCNQYTWYVYNMYMYCTQVYNQAPKMFPALLEMLTDECDEVSWKWVYVVITAHGTCI